MRYNPDEPYVQERIEFYCDKFSDQELKSFAEQLIGRTKVSTDVIDSMTTPEYIEVLSYNDFLTKQAVDPDIILKRIEEFVKQ